MALSGRGGTSSSHFSRVHSVPVIWSSDIWSFWLYFGYLVLGKHFPLYDNLATWSFRLYGQFLLVPTRTIYPDPSVLVSLPCKGHKIITNSCLNLAPSRYSRYSRNLKTAILFSSLTIFSAISAPLGGRGRSSHRRGRDCGAGDGERRSGISFTTFTRGERGEEQKQVAVAAVQSREHCILYNIWTLDHSLALI